jgi:hypothetical protein
MKFDMNRAWSDAMALFAGNREVIAVVGGVFFLLPDFGAGILFADMIDQAVRDFTAMMEAAQAESAMVPTKAVVNLLILSLAIGLIKLFGIAALLGLLNDRGRPTLGQALALGGKSMPSLFASILLYMAGMMLLSLAVGLVAFPVQLLVGPEGAGALSLVLYAALLFYAMTRLSMTLPVIVLDKVLNPIGAFIGSWKLTRGKAGVLFAFYFLLGLGFFAISWVLGAMLLPALEEILGGGSVGVTTANLIASLIDALVLTVFACLVAAIHRQLSAAAVDLR